MQPITVKTVSLDEIHEDPANARKHDQKNLDAIRASLAEFGQVEPLVVQKKSGKVIGGNGRLAALREMGSESTEIVEVDLSDIQATALGIALNRTAELAEWDREALSSLLGELSAADGIDEMLCGFDEEQLQILMNGCPDFQPIPEGEQSRLDEKSHATCPECGHRFIPA